MGRVFGLTKLRQFSQTNPLFQMIVASF